MKDKVYLERYGCNRRNSELSLITKYLESNHYEIVNNPTHTKPPKSHMKNEF